MTGPGSQSCDRPVCVFAPSLFLTVTIETSHTGTEWGEVHLHPGGQGFWIARLLAQLGCRPVLCGPVGGEAGAVLSVFVPRWGVEMRSVEVESPTPCHIDDRRSGRRMPVARDRWRPLHRHDVDDLYGSVLQLAIETGTCVITGRYPGDRLPVRFFARLGADLRRLGVIALGDLYGEELDAYLERGTLAVLKVSDEDLVKAGVMGAADEEGMIDAVRLLASRAIEWVVVSRAEKGAVVSYGGEVFRAIPPVLEIVDPTGAGDSMTAALVSARMRGLRPEEAIRLGCAAGAANVTRHGLGSASVDLIERIAAHVQIEKIGVIA